MPRPDFRSLPSPGSTPPRSLRGYRVILHRSTDCGLLFIVRVVRELTRFSQEEAQVRMWKSYHWGRATVLVTHLERAELFVEQFAARGLIASVEPT